MNDAIRAWLNGGRDYKAGVVLYSKHSQDGELTPTLLLGDSPENRKKLFYALRELVAPAHVAAVTTKPPPPGALVLVNTVAEAAKREADRLYKEMMNARAEMLGLCTADQRPGENAPELVFMRGQLAEKVVAMQPKVDAAYAVYRYAEEHWELPAPPAPPAKEVEDVDLLKAIAAAKKAIKRWEAAQDSPKRAQKLAQHNNTLSELLTRYEGAKKPD